MKNKGNIVSLVQLAAVFAVHRNTVAAWVKRGCPYLQKADRSQGIEWQFDTAEVHQWRTDQAVTNAVGDTSEADQEELYRRKLAAETTIAEVNAAKQRGEVADLEEVERQWRDTVLELRARIRQIPIRVAPQLLGVTELAEIKEILLDEVDESLTTLAFQFDDEE